MWLLTECALLNPIPLNLISFSISSFSKFFEIYDDKDIHDEVDRGIAWRNSTNPSQYFHYVQIEYLIPIKIRAPLNFAPLIFAPLIKRTLRFRALLIFAHP